VTLDIVFSPAEIDASRIAGRHVAVIDVLRATSTILTALVNGARAVIPTDSVEKAVRTASSLGRDQAILCGERGSVAIEGFALGNSPLEFEEHIVRGRTLVMTTSNGTRALLAGAHAERCFVASFLNAAAATDKLADADDVVIICAGRQDRISLEDTVCAGLIGRNLARRVRVRPTDAARAAMVLAGRHGESPDAFLGSTTAGRQLRRLDLAHDVAYCAMIDLHTGVPEMRDLRITL